MVIFGIVFFIKLKLHFLNNRILKSQGWIYFSMFHGIFVDVLLKLKWVLEACEKELGVGLQMIHMNI